MKHEMSALLSNWCQNATHRLLPHPLGLVAGLVGEGNAAQLVEEVQRHAVSQHGCSSVEVEGSDPPNSVRDAAPQIAEAHASLRVSHLSMNCYCD